MKRGTSKRTGKFFVDTNAVIAAACLQFQTALLTADDHFDHVNKLHRLDWRKPLPTEARRKRR
jgi:predicted nucleic acid-binding protein